MCVNLCARWIGYTLVSKHVVVLLPLTHWVRVTHVCVRKLAIIGSDNGLLPGRRQAIILTNAGILLIGPLGTNFSEILIEIYTFSFKKMHLKVSSGKWRPSCLGLNVLIIRCATKCHTVAFLGAYWHSWGVCCERIAEMLMNFPWLRFLGERIQTLSICCCRNMSLKTPFLGCHPWYP